MVNESLTRRALARTRDLAPAFGEIIHLPDEQFARGMIGRQRIERIHQRHRIPAHRAAPEIRGCTRDRVGPRLHHFADRNFKVQQVLPPFGTKD